MFKSIGEYVDWCVTNGYTSEDGKPLKCHKCGSKEMFRCDEYYTDNYLEEYDVKCKQCKTNLGHWAYGNWELM